LNTWTGVGFDYPIAVDSTIRTTGGVEGSAGGEYDLAGNFLGSTYTRGADGFSATIDGTTDGTYNYTASHTTGDVIRFDSAWSNPVILFNTGRIGDTGGITYDPTDDTLWITGFGTDVVEHYAMDGTWLSSFATGLGSGPIGVLALDHADGTLWLNLQGGNQHTFHQFSKAGVFLSSETYVTLSGHNILGGEFQYQDAGGPIGTNYCGPANLNSSGQSAVITAFGSTTASDNLLALTASLLPQNVLGYFLNSDVQGFVPSPGGSQGNLCLGGGIGRHVKQMSNSGAAGELVINVDLTTLPRPGGAHSVVVGETWNFQASPAMTE